MTGNAFHRRAHQKNVVAVPVIPVCKVVMTNDAVFMIKFDFLHGIL